jgi:hypothetical protein
MTLSSPFIVARSSRLKDSYSTVRTSDKNAAK